MSRKKKKIKIKLDQTNFDILQSIRKSWGDFNPVTRVVEDKTKYNRRKEKEKLRKEEE